MDKEEALFCKRIKELAYQTATRGYATFTDFLNMNEMSLFHSIYRELPSTQYKIWGGYEDADRCMIGFYTEYEITNEEFDLCILKIEPLNAKFSNTLTHRDFLGAILNLGIDRCKIGDILIKENVGHVITNPVMGEFIRMNLDKIKHTNVRCSVSSLEDVNMEPSFIEITGSIASNRLDSVIALAFKTSRSSVSGLIAGGKVYVNSKWVQSNSYMVKEEEIVSVRGMGKFKYKGMKSTTKKGRIYATVMKYN